MEKDIFIMAKKDKLNELLDRGVNEVIVRKSLLDKLASGKRLRVKLGVDPTAPNIHLGHSVVLRKLKEFQELGHQAIFLVGDFTAKIGDPSDRLSTRQPLTDQAIKENLKKYKEQVGKILDLDKVKIEYNSTWYNKIGLAELLEVMSRFSVNQMLERDMFEQRLKTKKPLWVHELMYPILQGYDSVALQADVELGGTDQTFNMLAARTLQPFYQQPPQDIITVPLIEGTDGQQKMSMSIGNTIDLFDPPQEMFGKVMSVPDQLIIRYFSLLTDLSIEQVNEYSQALKKGKNPRDYKFKLASELVSMYHSQSAAVKAGKEFNRIFREKQMPDKVRQYQIKKSNLGIIDLVVGAKMASSKSEARRLIEQGGVYLDNKPVKDWQKKVSIKDSAVLKVGKRKFVKLVKR